MDEAAKRRARRIGRLRDEIIEEGLPLEVDGPTGDLLLDEVDYARRPAVHEGVSPRYGALIAMSGDLDIHRLVFPALVESIGDDIPIATARRLADGRTSFIGRDEGRLRLVCFDRTIEHEATAVQVADSDITVVQRMPTGWVRIFSPRAVVTWDGSRWWAKPRSHQLASAVAAAHPRLASPVLDGLAELCVHWLSAGRVGAVLVWHTEPARAPLGHLGVGARAAIPPLDVTQREHYAALLSVLAQSDRAALVSHRGCVDSIGIALRCSDEALRNVPAYRGTRHTSARRFSYDEPAAVVFTVSSAGPVTVFHRGAAVGAVFS